MARIIENQEGLRRIIKLNTEDILSVVREYQKNSHNTRDIDEIRSRLQDTVIFIPEDI